MKKLLLVLLVLVLGSCTVRMGAFAPRRPDIPEHQGVTNEDCQGCHDLSALPDHDADDDCLRCHHIQKGA